MNVLKVFKRLMNEQKEMALATCKEGKPNVRIVNFYYDERKEGIIYFSSFSDNENIHEFEKNHNVSCIFEINENKNNLKILLKESCF